MEQKPYKQKIFYDSSVVIPKLDEFKKDAVDKSYEIILEQKYKTNTKGEMVSNREPTTKSLEWILDICKTEHNVKITDVPKNFPMEVEKFQVVFVDDWYFAWCDITPAMSKDLINKYDLKKANHYER